MPRFFTPSENFDEGKVKITGDDARHIARALRMAVGDEITVADMQGREHLCKLTRIRDEECECEILESREGRTESPLEITLYMGYPKGDKLEVVIQKAVELGASRIIPFESSRCVKRPKDDKIEKQTARLQRIAEEAAKQCGRARLPRVQTPVSFKNAIAEARLSCASIALLAPWFSFTVSITALSVTRLILVLVVPPSITMYVILLPLSTLHQRYITLCEFGYTVPIACVDHLFIYDV